MAKTRIEILAAYAQSGALMMPRSSSWLLRWVDFFFPAAGRFWSTLRAPGSQCVIYYPDDVIPRDKHDIIWHELEHVRQYSPWYGPFVVPALYCVIPCPVLLAWGRWYLERTAWLRDIEQGRVSIDGAVQTLWRYYLWPWPRFLMRRWFAAKLEQEK